MKIKMYAILVILLVFVSFYAMSDTQMNFDIPVSVTVNGNYLDMDCDPFIYDGATYVPIRFICEALGADAVSWNSESAVAVIEYDGSTIELPAGGMYAYVNGVPSAVSGGVKLVNSRIYVPVRFVAQQLDADVAWDSTYYNVMITKSGYDLPQSMIDQKGYTNNDIYWLAKIINAESAGESMEGKIAVGNVILNRVKSDLFPDTIYDVIFDNEFGVQFEPTMNGTINNEPSFDSIVAAKRALEGESPAGSSLYFLNPKTAENSWIPNNRTLYKSIGNHDFYF